MTKSIPLTQGKFALVDDEDFEKLNKHKWTFQARGYAYRRNPDKEKSLVLWMHRVIMNPECGMEVDHINGNKLDNRKENLRLATRSQNGHNMPLHKRNTSGFKGVTFWKRDNNWKSQITVDGKNLHIGYFEDPKDAAKAYDKSAREHFGEFARLNFPDV